MPVSTTSDSLYQEAAIQDMMGKPPGWLLHSGLTTIAGVFLVFFGLTALISYPEKIEAPFLLQTEKVPLSIFTGSTNVIDTIFVESATPVLAGDTLLVFRSEVEWRPLQKLDLLLVELEQELYQRPEKEKNIAELVQERLFSINESNLYHATLQSPLTNLRTILNARVSYLQTNGVKAEIHAFDCEIRDALRLSSSLNRQVRFYDRELELQQKQADRMSSLEQHGIVSAQEAEQVTAQTISARRQREVLVSSDIQNELRVQQLRQRILQRKLAHREQLASFDRQVHAQLRYLRSALEEYKDRYFLIAREAGTLTWQPNIREQATVTSAEPLGFLRESEEKQIMVARLQLPTIGQGKAAIGDRVILEFAAYPSREYGQVEGSLVTLDPIALPDQQGSYRRLAVVELPDSLRTSYGKTLPFQYNLTGSAHIITAERTLLARLLDRFFSLTKNT